LIILNINALNLSHTSGIKPVGFRQVESTTVIGTLAIGSREKFVTHIRNLSPLLPTPHSPLPTPHSLSF
jgi:hypothetical protein